MDLLLFVYNINFSFFNPPYDNPNNCRGQGPKLPNELTCSFEFLRMSRMNTSNQKTQNQSSSSAKKKSGQRQHSRRRRPNSQNKKKGPPKSAAERYLTRLHELRDRHIEARKKYFELYFRADPQQKKKLERIFNTSLEEYRTWEAKTEHTILDGKTDSTYSTNHDLDFEALPVDENRVIEDPHFLPSQDSSEHKSDTEESTGALSDYQNYKDRL